jgi:hypothetical protein
LLDRFGALGLTGIALLLLALGLAVYTPQVAREVEDLRVQADRTRERADDMRRDLMHRPGSVQRAAQVRELFPTSDHAAADLRMVFAAAQKNQVELAKGEYALVPTGNASRLRRFEVTLPVKERYVTLKSFVADVLNAVPHASLVDLRIERHAANVDQLDARVHFALFYREP